MALAPDSALPVGTVPDVSVIIPNRDGLELLGECLDAVARLEGVSFETILVDDASQDNSCDFVAAQYPWVRQLHSSDGNIAQGFARTCNVGIRASRGRYVALLNNDTSVDSNWLAAMVKVLDEDKSLASTGCRMYLRDGKTINTIGLALTAGGDVESACDKMADGATFDTACDIFGPSGGGALWRRSVLDEIGLFDESYFAYYEDADLALRARLAGYGSRYVPEAKMIHLEGSCPSLSRYEKVRLRRANRLRFMLSNFPGKIMRRRWAGIMWEGWLRHLKKNGIRPWKEEGRAFWSATGDVIRSLPEIMRLRKKRLSNASAENLAAIEQWFGYLPCVDSTF